MYKAVIIGTAHPHVIALGSTCNTSDQIDLIGVWDEDMQRGGMAAEKLGVSTIASLDDLFLQKPDLVLIGAVPCDRAQLAMRAIEAGAAVLMDKPIAVTHDALDKLIAAADKAHRTVMVYYPYRGDRHLLAAKAQIDAGTIGQIVRVASYGPHKLNAPTRPGWHWTRKHNGGILIDIGSHHADLCCWLTGQQPNWICAQHGNLTQPDHPEFQDFGHMQMRFPGGQFGYVEVDWLNPASIKHFGDSRIHILGTRGKIEIRLSEEVYAYIWTNDAPRRDLNVLSVEEHGNWTLRLVEDLAAGRPCVVPQEDVWTGARVTLHAFDSAEAGGKAIASPKF